MLKNLKKENPNQTLKIVKFSRDFGKEAGILAGLKNSTGDYVVIMDADMQDPPYLLPSMLETLKNEFKQAYGYYDVKDQQYIITGEKMIMKCGYDENEQKMYVTYVGKITADRRNINIKR